ncbi:MAG: DinB family protein [Pyrinomonadaceae bacterium]|nr:DinB family protein [Pyrinomonadaceae bacterium]
MIDSNANIERESWLEGALPQISKLLMPSAHALVQSKRDIQKTASGLTLTEIWLKPNFAPSAAFHLRHIAGSIDRLLTYARNESLTEKQFQILKAENDFDNLVTNVDEIVLPAIENIEKALQFILEVEESTLFEQRFVGREKLLTNVFGLLFHIAEHTQRHTGQLIATARIVRQSQF